MGGGVETPDTFLVRRSQWKERRRGEGGVETPDTSLVRSNQKRGGRVVREVVWRPLTRLWSGETKRNRRRKGADKRMRREGGEEG